MGVINRLPELLANQIAAGEVVGSPASLIKELVENSVDAGSSYVIVSVKEGGKKSIQVIDDGVGMSPDDALLAFERHATSKIGCVDDLFNISTFGFRGEALASIAAVSEVELRTKREEDEIGTKVVINGGTVIEQCEEYITSPSGTQIVVNNLFYNIPARKKSLKSDTAENRRISSEFTRIALAYHHVAFSLYCDNKPLFMLTSCNNIRQRIKYVMGSNISSSLIDLYVDTTFIEVKGYVGKPEIAKKRAETFFFVNGRYFESPYLYKAVQSAFSKLLPDGSMVPFFIFLKVNPENVDVNITPTKTSVKFDDEQAVWQIVNAVVRESLGKNGIVPMLDFTQNTNIIENTHNALNTESSTGILNSSSEQFAAAFSAPIEEYNPFTEDFSFSKGVGGHKASFRDSITPSQPKEEMLEEYSSPTFSDLGESFAESYETIDTSHYEEVDSETFSALKEEKDTLFTQEIEVKECFLINNRYGAASIGGELFVFDIYRTTLVVNYNKFIATTSTKERAESQKLLFPIEISVSAADKSALEGCFEQLSNLGFIIEEDSSSHNLIFESVPSDIEPSNTEWFIEDILTALKFDDLNVYGLDAARQTAASLARTASRGKGSNITAIEFKVLLEQLFKCSEYSYTFDGKRVFTQFSSELIKQNLG